MIPYLRIPYTSGVLFACIKCRCIIAYLSYWRSVSWSKIQSHIAKYILNMDCTCRLELLITSICQSSAILELIEPKPWFSAPFSMATGQGIGDADGRNSSARHHFETSCLLVFERESTEAGFCKVVRNQPVAGCFVISKQTTPVLLIVSTNNWFPVCFPLLWCFLLGR